MNTPAHAVVSLLVLGDKKRPELGLPVVLGGLLPDAPIVVFYAYQKLVRGMPESWIWSQGYYLDAWQGFFDVPNSLPLILLGLLLAWWRSAAWLTAFFASMALHVAGDWPLHHDDAHRHLYPFSDWRFESPVSYWDPHHYGGIVAPLEALLVIAGGIVLMRRYESRRARLLIGGLVALYAAYLGYVLWVWV